MILNQHNHTLTRKLFLFTVILAIIAISGIQYSYAQAAEHVLSFGRSGQGPGQFDQPQGIATNGTHLFVTDSQNYRVQIFDIDGTFVKSFGSRGGGPGEFNSVAGIATNGTHLFIVDQTNQKIHTWDINGNYISEFENFASMGSFSFPDGITTDNTNFFVVDTFNHRVVIFDTNSNYVNLFLGPGSGGALNQPAGIATNGTHLFVADSGNNRIQIFDIDGRFVKSFGSQGIGPSQFNSLNGITVSSTHIFVADAGNSRIQIFDINGNYAAQFGSTGTANGQFSTPNGLVTNGTHLFVADQLNQRVQVFLLASSFQESCADNYIRDATNMCVIDTEKPVITVDPPTIALYVGQTFTPPNITISDNDVVYSETAIANTTINTNHPGIFYIQYDAPDDASGNTPVPAILTVNVNTCPNDQFFNGTACTPLELEHVLSFGSAGTDNGEFDTPTGIATNNTHIFVTDSRSHMVQIWDTDGNYVKQFGSQGIGDGEFATPEGIATNSTHLFVVDSDNHRVQIFDNAGNYVAQFGSMGDTDGKFNQPVGIATNSTHLFVTSVDGHRVQIFDTNGNYLSQFGSAGTGNGQLSQPRGITTTSTHIFVSDTNNYRVQVFDHNGNHVNTIGSQGNSIGEFEFPRGIIVRNTHIFVADGVNDIIQVFDINGNYITQFGGTGPANGQFNNPVDIATNSTHVFVTDANNERVQVFTFSSILEIGCADGEIRDTTDTCIEDTESPVIIVMSTMLTLEIGQTFTPPTSTISDNDPAYTGTVAASTIDTTSVGTHTIQYTAPADASGNEPDTVTVTVEIVDTTAPMITVAGSSANQTFSVISGGNYTELPAILSDNDPAYSGTVMVTTTPSAVDTSMPGAFNVTYMAPADASGNTPFPVVHTVNVVRASDTMPPEIALTGANPQNITLSTAYTELGATCTDDIDGTINPIINSSNVNVTTVGSYTVTYDCADAAGNDAPQATRTVNVVTLPDTAPQSFEHILTFGSEGTGNGNFTVVSGITTNNTHLFVVDANANRIQIFNVNGEYVAQFGGFGSNNGQFNQPNGITTNGTHLFVADTTSQRVQIFDINGNYASQFGSSGSADGLFNSPFGITTNNTHLFISESGNDRIQIFDINGNHVSTIGGLGSNDGEFRDPSGITTTATHIFVADTNNHRIQIFDHNGQYVDQFGGSGNGAGEFVFPEGITTNNMHLFVSDTNNHRIQIFDNMGNYVAQFGSMGDGDGEFNGPKGIAINNTHIFVVDSDTRIQIFALPSSLQSDTSCADGQIRDSTGTCIMDTESPKIIVTPTTVTLSIGQTFTPIIIVSDNDPAYAGSVTANTTINTDNPGTFVIRYDASDDASGNRPDPVLITIIVEAAGTPDTTPPTIAVYPLNTTLEIGDTFIPPTVTIIDNDPAYVGAVSNSTTPSDVDTSSVGVFTITYNAPVDAAGNTPIPVNATVEIVDTTAPTIAVNGNSANQTISITLGVSYTVPVGNVTDNDPAYSETVTFTPSTIDTSSPGTFTIQYMAPADDSGNTPNPVVLTVNVACPTDQIFNGSSCVAVLEHVSSFGTSGSNNGQFTNPHGITTNDTHIFIVDFGNSRVQVYDHNGNYANTIGITGSVGPADGQFNSPVGITANNTHIFVADFGNHRIQIFDNSGAFVSKFGTGSAGSADGQFSSPQKITTNGTHLFVADSGNNRIQIFDVNGTFVSKFGTGSAGNANGQFNSPQGIIATRTHLYIADSNNNRVQVFDHNGNFVNKFGIAGFGNGGFSSPRAITSTDTHIFVADTGNHRIQIFDHDGTYVSKIGGTSSGNGTGQFNQPVAITANNTHVLVADLGNNRIQVFQLASLMSCPDANQVRDNTNTCITDTSLPVITVGGNSSNRTVTLTVGTSYTVPTGVVTDNDRSYSGTVRSNTTSIDTSSAGTFAISYTASADDSGNTPIPVVLTVNVVAADTPDTEKPVIEVHPTSITLELGQTFTPPIVNVTDNDESYSGIITSSPSTIDITSLGSFNITYTATADAAGNVPIPVIVTVEIVDTTLPVITIGAGFTENGTISGRVGSVYTEPAGVVTDNDPDYSETVKVTTTPSAVDTSMPGVFNVTYTAPADASGNTPLPIIIFITIACPEIPSFNGTACEQFEHVLSFGDQEKKGNGTFNTPYGIDANSTHIFVADTFNHRIQILDINGNYVSQFGSLGTTPGTFAYPFDIATNSTHFFITDAASTIHVYDSSGNYVTEFGVNGTGAGEFYAAQGIATNSTHLFVSDTNNKRVQILDFEGNFVTEIRETGVINGVFGLTYGIEANSTHFFTVNNNNHRVDVFDFSGNYISRIGSCCSGDGNFINPRDVAPTTNNTFILSSSVSTSPADPTAGLITVFDSKNGSYVTRFASTGNADGSLSQPQGIATDNTHLFVADTANHRIQILDFDGNFVSKAGGDIFANGELSRPFAVTTNTTHIFVADTNNHRIQIFDNTGEYVRLFGGFGTANGQFNAPLDIITTSIHLFVVDINNHRVQVFDHSGNYVNTIGSLTTGDATAEINNGKFYFPWSLSLNSTHLFVGDNTNRIQIFDMSGNYAGQFGSSGNGNGQFNSPRGITSDGTHLFISDRLNHRVQVFDHNGNYVSQFGTIGTGNGEFNGPIGISTNSTHLFVSDTGNHRIQIFDTDGNYVNSFGGFGNSDGLFVSPRGIVINSTQIFVADTENHRIQIFDTAFSESQVEPCTDGQIRDTTNTCVTDIMPPEITATPTTITLEIGDAFTPPTVTVMDNDQAYVGTITNTTTSAINTIGTFTITYNATADATGNIPIPVIVTVEIVDTTLPEIEVDGNSANHTDTVMIGVSYTVPTGIVTDNDPAYSESVTANNTSIDTNSTGTFTIRYTASADASGNEPLPVILTVNVEAAPDTTRPVITVDGDSTNRTITLTVGDPYTEPVGLVDDVDDTSYNETVTVATTPSPVDTAIPGSFNVTYTASADASGNEPLPVILTVNVEAAPDTTPPLITVNGDSTNRTITLTVGDPYTEPVGLVDDVDDTSYNETVTVATTPSPVDTAIPGSFNVTYTASADASGNEPLPVILTVNVEAAPDTTPPLITVNGDSTNRTITLTVGDPYTEQVGLVDDVDDASYSGTVTIATTPSPVDTTRPATFTILYTSTDANTAGLIPVPVMLTVIVSCQADQSFNGTMCITHAFEHVLSFGDQTTNDKQLRLPRGIAINFTHIFVADTDNHKIQIFDNNGNFVHQFGVQGDEDGEFEYPIGIITNSTHIFVSDRGNDRIQIFDKTGNYAGQFGSNGFVDGAFKHPHGIATNSTHIFVADTNNNRIQIFDINGNFVRLFGSFGTANGQFKAPLDIAANSKHLFISDRGNDRIQIFDNAGNYVSQFGSNGTGDGEFYNPRGITTNSTHLFVVDSGNHRVQIFDNNGTYVHQFGSNGNGDREFRNPVGITSNSTHLFVSDTFNHRVQVFEFASIVACTSSQIRTTAGCITDTTPPAITLTGPSFITILQNSTYTVLSPTTYDIDPRYDGSFTTSHTTDPLDTSIIGTITITYTATDPSNNTGTVTQSVDIVAQCPADKRLDSNTNICVTDTILPVIEVDGSSENRTVTVIVGEPYIVPAGNVTDNVLGYSGTITVDPNTISTSSAGIFNVTYTATADAAGNTPLPVVITVNVVCPIGQLFKENSCIVVLEHVLSFGSKGTGDEQFRFPQGIITNSTHIFVTDTTNDRVQIFDNNGTYVHQFGGFGNGTGQFDTPRGITTNSTHIFVTDTFNNRVQIFDINGEYVAQFESVGFGVLNNPRGITTNSTHIFVADTGNSRIQIFDINGEYVSMIERLGLVDDYFRFPIDIALNSTHIFVSEMGNHRVVIFDNNGNYAGQFGSNGTGNGEFNSPSGIATNSTHIFVVDRDNHRIQLFDINGEFVGKFGSLGNGTGEFDRPRGIATNSTHLFVSDTFNHRIQIFEFASIVACTSSQIRTTAGCITDTTPPVITLTGPSSVTILQNSTYTVLPPTISDNDRNYDGSFTTSHTIDPLDTSNIGTITITYTATDPSNNTGTITQSIDIVAQCPANKRLDSNICVTDITPPVIRVNSTTITLELGDAFTPPTVNVTDNDPDYVGIITNSTTPSIVNINTTGTFTIMYNATADAAGNAPNMVNVTVEIVDTTLPSITVDGNSANHTDIVMIGVSYTVPDGSVTDNDPAYSESVTANNTSIDTNSTGTFVILYTASADAAGNEPLPVALTVNVVAELDTTLPVIGINSTSITLEIGDAFTPPIVNVTDNDPDYSGIITSSPSTIDITSLGTFTITYNATADAAGNAPIPVIVTVEIVDTTLPTITIGTRFTENYTITARVGSVYTEPAGVVTDNDPDYSETVTVTTIPSAVDTSMPGVFNVTYAASADASGNTPIPVMLTITISCPPDQPFNETTCLEPFQSVLSFGNEEKSGIGKFNTPYGIDTNSTHIFVADTFNHRIQILDINGNYVKSFGSLGDTPGKFNYPTDIATNSTHFFILDATSTIHVYDINGNYVTEFDIKGISFAATEFSGPQGIATNSTHLFVSDTNNKRIQILDFEGNFITEINETGLLNGGYGLTYGIATNSTHFFTTNDNNHRVDVFDFSGNYISRIGSCCVDDGEFIFPRDVAPTTNNTFILSSKIHPDADPTAGLITVFDSKNGSYITRFANIGNADGSLAEPQGIATDNTHLFVADTSNHRIQILDFDGNFVSKAGGNITANGEISRPFAVTANSTHIFVADSQNHRVQIFDNAGKFVSQFGGLGNGTGQLNFPIDIAINSTHIFVAEFGNHRVQVFDNNGNYAYTIGERAILTPSSTPGNNGKFGSPLALDLSSTHLFVSDATNRLQVFDMDGNYIRQFGDTGLLAGPNSGDDLIPDIRGITTHNNHLFITDHRNHRVQVWNIDGNFVSEFGKFGTGDGEFRNPIGISTNNTHLFVSDKGNHRVQIFDIDGNYVNQFGSHGNTDGMLLFPNGIAINSTHVFVADTNNNRIQIFALSSSLLSCTDGQIRDIPNTCIDDTLPEITANPTSITLEIGDTFTPPTVTIDDDDPSYSGTITNTTTSAINTIGTFTITYMGTADAAGNTPDNVIVTVDVVDTTVPTISANPSSITLRIGELFTPPTVNVTDNDPAYVGIITNSTTPSDVDTSNTGTFTITYMANADASNNAPDNVTVNVIVTNCDANQILDNDTNTCITDTAPPMIMVSSTSITLEIGDTFTPPTVNVTDNDPAYVGIITNTTTSAINTIGTFTVTYMANADAAGNAPDNVIVTVDVVDTESPTISVNPPSITLRIGELFTPPTVNVTDNDPAYVGIITNNTTPSDVDTSNTGSFSITYTATADASGNGPVSVTVPVIVTNCDADQILDNDTNTCITDTAPPMIMVSSTSITLEIGDTFTPPTVNVTDNDPAYVGIITNTTTSAINTIGTFTITYMGTADAAGNVPDNVIVTVDVVDTTVPTISVNPPSITLKIGESYTPPTFGVTDNDPAYSGTVTAITTPSAVDTSSIGSFTVTHSAPADASGNIPDNVTTTVSVTGCDADQILDSATNTCITDTELPTIEVNPSSITLEIDEPFTPPTVTIDDNDPSYSGTITNTTTPSDVDTSNVGVFTITYMGTADAAGNAPDNVIVTVDVVDTESPEITANPPSITLQIGDAFTPPTVNVTDNDPAYVGTITNTTTSAINTIGTFTVTYMANADAAGNAPDNVIVTVDVVDTESPTISVNPPSITLRIGDTFTPPTVNVTDNDPAYVGIITNSTTPSDVDTSNTGSFSITYTATADASGNGPVSVTVPVIVNNCDADQILDNDTNTCITDTAPPMIMVSSTTITLEIGDTFTPPIVSIMDNDPAYVGTITNTTTSAINTIGTFTVTYMANADAAGNAPDNVTVTVNVVDTTVPTISANPPSITLQIGELFTPPIVTVMDNDPNYVGIITNSTTPSDVDTSNIGTFTITYNATADASSNAPTLVIVTVNVVGCDANQILDNDTNTCVTVPPPVQPAPEPKTRISFGSGGGGGGGGGGGSASRSIDSKICGIVLCSSISSNGTNVIPGSSSSSSSGGSSNATNVTSSSSSGGSSNATNVTSSVLPSNFTDNSKPSVEIKPNQKTDIEPVKPVPKTDEPVVEPPPPPPPPPKTDEPVVEVVESSDDGFFTILFNWFKSLFGLR